MGNKLSRRREAPASSEQKPAGEHSAPKPTAEPGLKQEAVGTDNLDVLVEEKTKDECESEAKEGESPVALDPREDADSKTSGPVQPEALVSETSPPDSLAAPKPEATEETEAQVATNMTPVDVSEPLSALQSDPIPELLPTQAEAAVRNKDQEPLTDPVLPPAPLIDFGFPDVISSPSTIPLDPDESSNTSATEHSFAAEPEALTSDILEESTGVEAEECLKTLGSDINLEKLSELLKENDLLGDITSGEVQIPVDTSTADMSTSMELM